MTSEEDPAVTEAEVIALFEPSAETCASRPSAGSDPWNVRPVSRLA